MNSKRHLSIMMVVVLAGATLVACGGERPPPTTGPATPTTANTPTPSAADHILQGIAYAEQDRLDEAMAEFQMAVKLEADNPDAHRNLGSVYGRQSEWKEAVVAYEKAVELNPDFAGAYADLAVAYVELGRLSEAVAAGEKAIELAPDHAPAHNNLAIAYREQGSMDGAIAAWEEAIRLAPDYALAHANLGRAYGMQGRLEEASAELQEAIRLEPDLADAHFNLGMVYYLQERMEEALVEFQRAITIEPGHAMAHHNLGIIYRDRGQGEEALAAFETYLQSGPDAPDRATVEEEIAKLKGPAMVWYRNAAGGYGLLYPEGWYYAERENEVGLAPSREDYQASSLRSPLLTFIVWPLAEAVQDFGLEEDAAPGAFLGALAAALEAETGEIESTQISGYPAAFAATSGSMDGTPYRGALIVILVEERLFLAEGLAPIDQWASFRSTFVDMVNSLSFLEPQAEEDTARGDYNTAFPLPANVRNFTGQGGESQVNFQTDLAMDEVIAFYRDAFAEMDLSEYDLLTSIEDEDFSMVFTGWPSGEQLVIQGVVFGESTNVNIRLEEVLDS